MPPLRSHTVALTAEQAESLRAILREQGFKFEPRPYTIYFAQKPGLTVAVYEKGPKAVIQGKETQEFVEFTLEPAVLGEARLGYEELHHPERFAPHFGIDESGKGDFFGPLVIAGAYTDATVARRLLDAGVMDSKRIQGAARIRQLAQLIRNTPGCHTELVSIGPARYNELYQSFGNLNHLLAWGHARVIEKLATAVPSCPRALSDQFAHPQVLKRALKAKNLTIELEQRTKGESDIAVAAASIIARERFIDWMDQTSAACGIQLPLGASAAVVRAGRELVAQRGAEALGQAAKLHFRTTHLVFGTTPPPKRYHKPD